MKKSIVWLASYPKSGNTWTRIFLANYLTNAQSPVPINQVHRFGMGDSIVSTYEMVAGRKINPSDISLTLSLRNKVLRGIVANNADVNLVKTHNIRSKAFGIELIPDQFTRSAIYIVRNPLDMVISYARHYGETIEKAAEAIGRSDNSNDADKSTVTQFLGTWSEHVDQWTKPASYPICVLRYEDMLNDPQTAFSKLLEHLGVPVETDRLDRAIRFSSFDEVSKQEQQSGFVERSQKSDRFFGKGKSGYWRGELPDDIADKIMRDHERTMKRFGYLE